MEVWANKNFVKDIECWIPSERQANPGLLK